MGTVKKAPLSQQNSSYEKKTTASSPKSSFLPERSLEDAWDEKGEKTESQTAGERRMPGASHALGSLPRQVLPSGESLPLNTHHK